MSPVQLDRFRTYFINTIGLTQTPVSIQGTVSGDHIRLDVVDSQPHDNYFSSLFKLAITFTYKGIDKDDLYDRLMKASRDMTIYNKVIYDDLAGDTTKISFLRQESIHIYKLDDTNDYEGQVVMIGLIENVYAPTDLVVTS